MAADKLKLEVLLNYVDKLSRPLSRGRDESRQLARSIKETEQRIRELNTAQSSLMRRAKSGPMPADQYNAWARATEMTERQTARLNEQLQQQRSRLDAINKATQRQAAIAQRAERIGRTRDSFARAGVGMTAAGIAVEAPIVKAVRDYSRFEDAMAGVARQVDGARDDNGKLTAAYYEMGEAIQRLAANKIPLATTEIAALVEAAARMGIQGKENLLAFAETAGVSAAAFDIDAGEIGENLGKIAGLYKIPIARISELGDAINYLDDNAQSQGADIIDVLQRMGGVADKLDYKKAAALGSTFLSLGARAEVAASAANAMVRELAIAEMQPRKFQAGIKALGMSSRDIQAGMSRDATGTILRVLDAVKRLPATEQMAVTTRIFGKEYGDDAAKLANNLDEYRRQLELVSAASSRGSMQREADIKNQLLSARWQMVQNRLFAQSAELGRALQPTLLAIMESISRVVDATTAWTKRNPGLANVLMHVVAIGGLLLIILGGLALTAAAVLAPFALMGGASAGLAATGAVLSSALGLVRFGIMAVGRALLMNPIGLAVSAIAVAALLIYEYWDPIKAFFQKLIDGIVTRFNQLKSWFQNSSWLEIGRDLLLGLIAGIKRAIPGLGFIMDQIGKLMPEWLRKKLDIHSPSRVFQRLGEFTMAGLDVGLTRGMDDPLTTVSTAARRIAVAGATSLSMAGAPSTAATGGPITIHVHAAPGMDEEALTQLVARKFEALTRSAGTRARSLLIDAE